LVIDPSLIFYTKRSRMEPPHDLRQLAARLTIEWVPLGVRCVVIAFGKHGIKDDGPGRWRLQALCPNVRGMRKKIPRDVEGYPVDIMSAPRPATT
jgi:hypothetical protein